MRYIFGAYIPLEHRLSDLSVTMRAVEQCLDRNSIVPAPLLVALEALLVEATKSTRLVIQQEFQVGKEVRHEN